MNSDYTEAEMQRVRAEVVELRPRQKPNGAGRKRKLAGTSNRPKRDRRELKDNRSAEGRPWRPFDEPALRPLHNLDRIAANPDASIVVCDSENAASAAARVFPEWIAMASSGDAQAAARTDWRPLAGRRALIWPANGARKQARGVAAALAELDCEASVVDAAALAAIDPAGGEREPEDGYDAANALAEWNDTAALRKIVEDFAEPFGPGPSYINVGAYRMDANGLTIDVKRGRGKDKRTEALRIAAPFEVVGVCRDPRGVGWGKRLRWRDRDGRKHERHVADADLHGEPATLCAALQHEGLWIDRKRQAALADYLLAVPVTRRLRRVERTGWHEIEGQSHFVLPDQTIGPRGAEKVFLEKSGHGVAYEARGTVEEWREGVAKLAGGHVMPVLAISAAFAGPLLHLAGDSGGGLHFLGQSSIGKSTLLRMAASVWGRGAERDRGYVQSWRATANGLEGLAASASDTALILDEIALINARELADAVYALANGSGKNRAGRDGASRERKTWRALTVSSGEFPIEAKLAEDRGRKPRAGQLVRMLDIPAARAFGVFDSNGPDRDAASYAKACGQAAMSAFGTAGPEFVRRLVTNGVTGDDVRSGVKEFTEAQVPPGADGQVDRAAQRLGLVAFAGKLATRFGLTPWREGEATAAAAWALKQWIKGRGGAEPAEVRQAIEQVRLLIERYGASRFEDRDNRDPDARPVNDRLGWRKGAGADQQWWIPRETWKTVFCEGFNPQEVARVLFERGMLHRQGGNELCCRVNIGPGPRQPAYVLTAAILTGGDEDDGSGDER